ncbi:MAG: efflux RND transporter permease subunit, partial [bacterium]|nr:efflux RND transporter permease subunit [bacterium]
TSLNIMSLGGLALGVGMLVDNAIVVLEAIFKHREAGASPLQAARKGASEVGRAVIASTLTTVAVFLPVVFLEGVAAQLFRDQALTVSFSLIASLAVSLTLIPMLAALVGGGKRPAPAPAPAADMGRLRRVLRFVFVRIPGWVLLGLRWFLGGLGRVLTWLARPLGRLFDAGMNAVADVYPRLLVRALRARWVVVAMSFLLFAGAVYLVPTLGLDLIPPLSQGEFSFRVELPEGTPLDGTDGFIAGIEEVLAEDPRVESYSAIAGGAGLSLATTGTEGENVARIQVRMKPDASTDDEDAVAAVLRQELDDAEVARFKFERPSVFTVRTPVEVEIYGDNLEELHTATAVIANELDEVSGLVDLKSTAELGNPEIQVTFNRDQLVQLGLDLSQVAATVRNKVQGDVATHFTEGDREIDILVRSVELGRASVDDVGDLIIGQRLVGGSRTITERTETGILLDRQVAVGAAQRVPIRLKSVADIELVKGPSEIRRISQKRAAVVSGNIAGRDMGAVAADMEQIIHAVPLPLGVTPELGGQQEEMARSLKALLLAMGMAIFLVYLVMASQFESFLHPFVIIFTLPLGAIGVVAALALTGQTVNVVALIGAVMLAGIVVNNAIVLVDRVNQLRREQGLAKNAALVEAGSQRLRPILMTSATTIFGLMPMALGLGEGAELRAPLAITVIGGLAVATFLTLIVIPVVYSLVDRKQPAAAADETDADAPPYGTVALDAAEILEAGP